MKIILASPLPQFLTWGKKRTFIYNDAFISILGETKHPGALGSTHELVWSEAWETLEPLLEDVARGETHHFPDHPFRIERNGKFEDGFFTFTYSPLTDDNDEICGVFCTTVETTQRNLAQRDLNILEHQRLSASNELAEERSKLENVLAQMPVGVCLLEGPEHRYTFVNSRYYDFFGGERDLLGKSVLEALPELQGTQVKALLDGVFETGAPYYATEFSADLAHVDGSLRRFYLNFAYEALKHKDGEIYGISVTATDVTEQVLGRTSAEAGAARFRQLADSMPQVVWTAEPDGNLDYFNRVWFDYSGSSYEENAGSGWAKFVHPEDIPAAVKRWQHSIETGDAYETEFRLRAQDGTYKWFVARAIATRGEANKITKWYGTNTDIDKSKRLAQDLSNARSQIEAEQTKFKTIFADSRTSMAILQGKDFVYEIANESYLSLFNGRELIGKPFLIALPELEGQQFPRQAESVFKTGRPYREIEAKAFLQRTDGGPLEERYFDQTYSRVMDVNGEPYGVFIHATEVTDRVLNRREIEESAEHLRIAVESANMGTWELDPRTNVVNWSERTRELFGVKGDHTLTLDAAVGRIHPEDLQRVLGAIAAALDPTGNGDYAIEYRTISESGELRWLSLLGKAFFESTPNGKTAARFVGTVIDMTERKFADDALRAEKERAESASSAKSSFLANMSHEIRTPLGAIMGFVSLLKDSDLNQQTMGNYVSIVERNASQLLRIIDDILDLSKVEAGLMLIEHIDFSLVELLSDFASLIGFRAREKGVLFELKAKTELPDIVNSDPTRIRQILMNVVGNAIKFTDRGSVILSVAYEGDQLIFEVEDTGRGISIEQRKNLFQPFSQADVSTTRKYGGSGLGLVLTQKLSETMGGSFLLKSSKIDYGSIFVAAIPVRLAENSRLVKALGFESPPVREGAVHGLLRGRKILLVEDSPDNQMLFSIFLGRASAHLDIASDGAKGVEAALSGNYDVVLMDVQMPVMDGITAVRTLRKNGYKIPIIALTAHAMKEERVRCLEAGYTDFLSKPVQRADLIDIILKHVAPKASV